MATSGRYVAHIEDDNLWFPTHLEALKKVLQTADFGHLMHVWLKPDQSIDMLPSDLVGPKELWPRSQYGGNFFAGMTSSLARGWQSQPLSLASSFKARRCRSMKEHASLANGSTAFLMNAKRDDRRTPWAIDRKKKKCKAWVD